MSKGVLRPSLVFIPSNHTAHSLYNLQISCEKREHFLNQSHTTNLTFHYISLSLLFSRQICKKSKISWIKNQMLPWLLWLSGLSAGLRTKGSLVRFPVRAHAFIPGQVPIRGCTRGNHTWMFLSLSLSFPYSLSKNK